MSQAFIPNTNTHDTPEASLRSSGAESPLSGVSELKSLSRWVTWRLETRDDQVTKVLYNPMTGNRAAVNRPRSWSPYLMAQSAARKHGHNGVGFVFSMEDDLVAIDIDDVRDPETGIIDPWVMAMVKEFGTYAEPSAGTGKGIHIIGRGKKIHDRCRNWKHEHGRQIEVYEHGRFMTMSLDPLPGFEAIRDIQQPLDRFITEHWTQHIKQSASQSQAFTGDVSLESGEIIELARSHNPKFTDLYDRGDLSHYDGGQSEADAALCAILAWYTKSPSQILEIWQSSALYRDKTDRRDYADRTIEAALNLVTEQYDPSYGKQAGASIVLGNLRPGDTASLPDDVEHLKAELARERAMREQLQDAVSGITTILASQEYEAGAKLTAIGVYLEGYNQQRLRRKQTEYGYHLPASWIGKTVGMKPATVNNNLKKLEKAGVLERTVRSEEIEAPYRDIDQDSGTITEGREKRRGKRSYIKLPDNMVDFAARVAQYRKDPVENPEKRGGLRVPACDKHPEAELIRQTAYYCEGCYHEAKMAGEPLPAPLLVSDPSRAKREETESETPPTTNFGGDTPTVVNGYANFDVDTDDQPQLVARCSWHLGEGEECGEPTEAWINGGYGNQKLCERHAGHIRKSGDPPQRVTTVSRIYREEVAS